MNFISPAFRNEQPIPKKYTCDGENANPPFKIGGVPPQAQSLVLVVEDPDAPNGTYTHWIVWNIPPTTAEIAENSVPPGAVVGQGSNGKNEYYGPCPPSGTHRYFFRLYAIPKILDISNFSNIASLRNAMDGSIIAEAEVIGTYSRDNK